MENRLYLREISNLLGGQSTPSTLRQGRALKKRLCSRFNFLGLSIRQQRMLQKKELSFFHFQSQRKVLKIWDYIWQNSQIFEVLNWALEYYLSSARISLIPFARATLLRWATRIENAHHCELLARIYAHMLYSDPQKRPLSQLLKWGQAKRPWPRKLALLSLIPPITLESKDHTKVTLEDLSPLLQFWIKDKRVERQKMLGHVLRQLRRVYAEEMELFLSSHQADLSSVVLDILESGKKSRIVIVHPVQRAVKARGRLLREISQI